MSLFNHQHAYALSDEDQEALLFLARWDGKSTSQMPEYQIEHLVGQLYKAMDAMNDQRAHAPSSEVAAASSQLWRFYRDEHQRAMRLLDMRRRSLRLAA